MNDVLGQALYNFFTKAASAKLWIHNKYGRKEEMPVHIYFREPEEMPDLELIALQNCKGKVLDIGAGAGSHTLALQEKDFDVTALEISPKAAEVMRLRGVTSVVQQDIFTFDTGGFDTLLLLMNGIGLTGSISRLKEFLQHAKKLLNHQGQLIFDSSDVVYLYEGNPPQMENYYGEIMYQYEFKRKKTEWFSWLYIDQQKLTQIAAGEGWDTEVLSEDEFDQYVARLVIKQ